MRRNRSPALAIIIGGMISACGGAQPAPSTVVSSQAATAISTPRPSAESSVIQASPTASPALDIVWTEQQVLPATILALVADGDRFVAVGNTNEGQASWTSTDGARWDQHPVPPATGLPDESTGLPFNANLAATMGQLVRLNDTLYSFGYWNFMDFIQPVGWRWADGGAWEPITSASPFYGAGSVGDMAAGDGVLVAGRSDISISPFGANAEVWAWSAASSWVQGELPVAEPERVMLNQLAWSDGVFLASGAVIPEQIGAEMAWTPRMWQSADGHTWSQVAPPSEDAGVCALEGDPAGGFIAMSTSPGETAVWRWRDGNWSGTPLAQSGNPDHLFMGGCSLVPLSDRTVAILAVQDGSRYAWWSSDGASWVGGDTLTIDGVTHIAGLGATLVITRVEQEQAGGQLRTVVMTGSFP